MKIFYCVDCQKDFMEESGALYVPEAIKIYSNIKALCEKAQFNNLWASVDWHTEDDVEFKTFPKHCVRNTPGAELIQSVRCSNPVIIPKLTYDVFAEPYIERLLEYHQVLSIVVFGVVTEICVMAAVEGFLKKGLKVTVVTDAIQHLDLTKAQQLIQEWKKQGVLIKTTEEVING